jgi:hypothetical protein
MLVSGGGLTEDNWYSKGLICVFSDIIISEAHFIIFFFQCRGLAGAWHHATLQLCSQHRHHVGPGQLGEVDLETNYYLANKSKL